MTVAVFVTAMKIHASANAHELLQQNDGFLLIYRGMVDVKVRNSKSAPYEKCANVILRAFIVSGKRFNEDLLAGTGIGRD